MIDCDTIADLLPSAAKAFPDCGTNVLVTGADDAHGLDRLREVVA